MFIYEKDESVTRPDKKIHKLMNDLDIHIVDLWGSTGMEEIIAEVTDTQLAQMKKSLDLEEWGEKVEISKVAADE